MKANNQETLLVSFLSQYTDYNHYDIDMRLLMKTSPWGVSLYSVSTQHPSVYIVFSLLSVFLVFSFRLHISSIQTVSVRLSGCLSVSQSVSQSLCPSVSSLEPQRPVVWTEQLGASPAVVWILNALQGEEQQTAAQLPVMLFKPAVLPLQRNYERCNSFCRLCFFPWACWQWDSGNTCRLQTVVDVSSLEEQVAARSAQDTLRLFHICVLLAQRCRAGLFISLCSSDYIKRFE